MNIHDEQACFDQWQAAMRDYAENCRMFFDQFLKQDFTRQESLDLTMHYIDNATEMYHATT